MGFDTYLNNNNTITHLVRSTAVLSHVVFMNPGSIEITSTKAHLGQLLAFPLVSGRFSFLLYRVIFYTIYDFRQSHGDLFLLSDLF